MKSWGFTVGVFTRKYRWTVLVQKPGATYYTGGVNITKGIFPGVDVSSILEWVKETHQADSVQMVFLHRSNE